jgi:predicted adenine nucleotide alpha hydrolase (AANH) superfamily ATPase
MKQALLHICCAVCSSWAVQKLKTDGYSVTGLFYNPNIHPEEEYLRRLKAAQAVALDLNINLIEGPYDKDKWALLTKGYEYEPEGGSRCQICFRVRLEYTFQECLRMNVPYFASTLSISPHKDASLISYIGKALSQRGFLDYNFKKDDGFKKANDYAKHLCLYRQNYCGCVYSVR